MLYIYSILIIVSGVLLGFFGPIKYNISFASSYFLSAMATYFIFTYQIPDQSLKWVLIINLIIALGIFIFSKVFTYLVAWGVIAGPMLFIALKISAGGPNPILGLFVLILPAVIVYLVRKILRKITLGVFSGLSVGVGLSSIILTVFFKSGDFLNSSPIILGSLLTFSIAGGIFFQFSKFNIERLKQSEEIGD